VYPIVSDDLAHDQPCVAAGVDAILADLRPRLPGPITKLIVWSDGCGGQFKGKEVRRKGGGAYMARRGEARRLAVQPSGLVGTFLPAATDSAPSLPNH
jgi:hypothetical protein